MVKLAVQELFHRPICYRSSFWCQKMNGLHVVCFLPWELCTDQTLLSQSENHLVILPSLHPISYFPLNVGYPILLKALQLGKYLRNRERKRKIIPKTFILILCTYVNLMLWCWHQVLYPWIFLSCYQVLVVFQMISRPQVSAEQDSRYDVSVVYLLCYDIYVLSS